MRKRNLLPIPLLRRMMLTFICLLAFVYQAEAQVHALVTFDNTADLTTYFTEGSAPISPMSNISNLGIGGTGCINVQSGSSDIWTTKAGYSVSGAGDVYTLSAYFKNAYNSGYGALGFSTTEINTVEGYGAPATGLGMIFHGGGGFFVSNGNNTPVAWTPGDMITGTGSPWYKMILKITAKGNSTYDINFQIWNSDVNGVVGTKFDEQSMTGIINTTIGNASTLHVYFAVAGSRMEKIDNFEINLLGGATIVQKGNPVVITTAVSDVTTSNATCGGNVTSDNGDAVTARGVCWSTTSGPTIANTKTTNGSGTGTFTSSIGSLSAGTTYYVRSYATNSIGTSYGSEVSFTTLTKIKLADWDGVNTYTTTFPYAAKSKASFVTTAEESYGNGLATYNDSRNVWSTSSTATSVTPGISPYVSYAVTSLFPVTLDRFVVNGMSHINSTMKAQLRWSVDNYASSLGELTADGQNYTLTSVDLSSKGIVPAGTTTFRVYFYNNAGTSWWSRTGPYASLDGTSSSYSVYGDDVSIWYTSVSAVVPEVTGISPTSGSTAGSTSVIITGTNLIAATAVKFGSTDATSYTVNSATQITATSPAGTAGAVDVTVTTAGGTSATSSSDQFTYIGAPTATTSAASSVTSAGVTLNGSVNANNTNTSVTFEYGLTSSYGTSVTANPSSVTGSTATPVSYALSGLTSNTTYHYRVVGVNSTGTTNGDDLTFTTLDIAPNISYTTPQTYLVGTAITALSPVNIGGAVTVGNPVVSTFAGNVNGGSSDGIGSAASFEMPIYMAKDASGNLFVSDLFNNTIRKITTGGQVSTFVGASAGLNGPGGIAVDAQGNVFFAEVNANKIWKVTPEGVASVFAGSGTESSVDGNGVLASFHMPVGVALDALGNLYVADAGSNLIRKITPTAEVTTLAGSGSNGYTDGLGSAASFTEPYGLAVDISNNLYVADFGNNLIRKITPAGEVSTFAGNGNNGSDNGFGSAASFSEPFGVSVDGFGNVYVADSHNNLIREISPAGEVSTLAGSGSSGSDDGRADTATFSMPTGVCVDASGTVFVADAMNNLIRKITQSGYKISPALPAGLSMNETTGVISGTPTVASPASNYTVSASNNGGNSSTGINITVKDLQTISFGALDNKTYGDADYNPGATSATSGVNTITYTSSNTAVATIVSNQIHIVGVGTTNITAKQAGNTNYTAAPDVVQPLVINAKAIVVTAVTDTKTYNGTTVSAGTPTVGALATGDVVNVAPTQVFDNVNVGTAHVLTASGLTIKNASNVDVTANYTISYVASATTGVINKMGVTVTALTDTKTYNATTASAVIPTVGTLATGDVVNVAPTQMFDNATVGTAHVLTASGLTIKNASNADVTANYAITYIASPATGTINKMGVTVTALTDTKSYTGTTASSVIPTVGTLAVGDVVNVAPTQVFDNANMGTTHILTASGLTIKDASNLDVTANYAITYIASPATGIINKQGVTVTAVTDTKTYNGTTASAGTPIVGTLASGDVVNVLPTQVFDNVNVGTAHVLTASGLTIKDASNADVTANYAITYIASPATGIINKQGVTVTAVTDTKTYNGTTASAGTPIVGTLASGDVVNVLPIQVFDNATVGTAHVLTASGLTIKNGSNADVTANYAITYVPSTSTGTINKMGVTVTAVTDTKNYNGTTASAVIPTVGALATGDVVNVAPIQVFDNATIGSTHTLTASGLSIKNGSNADVTANYAITYIASPATGVINKQGVTVTAVTDTKTYNGTTVSVATPIVGALSAGDVVNVAPTQVFDNVNVGTTHVLTASGLTIKDASNVDVTANYAITYIASPATGVISAKEVLVTDPTITTNKVYDGSTVATVVAGFLSNVVTADVNNVSISANATYSDANAGSGKIITVHYTLAGSASTNYIAPADYLYTLTGAEIAQKQLTMPNPVVVTNKMVDGNSTAVITTTGTLQGVEAIDANNVFVTAVATYDNSAVGINKTITVVYTLTGSAKDNYVAPANYIITGAKISNNIALSPLTSPTPGCEGANLDLAYTILSGSPTQYKITFNAAAIAAGIQNVVYTNLPTSNSNGDLSIAIPKGTADGDYQGTLQVRNELGIESAEYAFQFTINVSSDYLVTKFSDVILCDNNSERFASYQWYKNGVAIEGATKQFYNDLDGLVGTYSLKVTTVAGKTLYTCPKELNISLAKQVKAYPNPVKISQSSFVKTIGFEDNDFEGAELSIYTLQGIKVYYSNKVENVNSLQLPPVPAVYIGHITTSTGKDYIFKVIVE